MPADVKKILESLKRDYPELEEDPRLDELLDMSYDDEDMDEEEDMGDMPEMPDDFDMPEDEEDEDEEDLDMDDPPSLPMA